MGRSLSRIFASIARAAEPAHYDIKASLGKDAALKANVESYEQGFIYFAKQSGYISVG